MGTCCPNTSYHSEDKFYSSVSINPVDPSPCLLEVSKATSPLCFDDKGQPSSVMEIYLSGNLISDKGAIILGNDKLWINLTMLYLSNNQISAKGAAKLSRNSVWTQLILLDLTNNNVGDEGVAELRKNITWKNLAQLSLANNSIGNEGARELSQNILE
jgi:hypothetical protein